MAWFNHKPITRKRKLLLLRTYLPDWIITAVILGLFYLLDSVDGFRRQFDLTDTSIQHTYTLHERVPNWLLGVICAVAPVVIILAVSTIYARSLWDLHAGWLGLFVGLSITATTTNIIKIIVGRPRPDLLARCQPPAGSQNPGAPNFGLSEWYICQRTDLLKDGFRSFPSGHSSLSWCGLGFLTLYLAGKMHVWDSKGISLKAWILLLPIMGALLVTLSRTMDFRHHATDVIAGSILGALVAWFAYRQYYPPLDHPLSHKPYSPRIPREAEDIELEAERGNLRSPDSPTSSNGLRSGRSHENGKEQRRVDDDDHGEGVPIQGGL